MFFVKCKKYEEGLLNLKNQPGNFKLRNRASIKTGQKPEMLPFLISSDLVTISNAKKMTDWVQNFEEASFQPFDMISVPPKALQA